MDASTYRLISLNSFRDSRGVLTPIDFEKQIDFLPKRTFILSDSSLETIRGEHAHRDCVQAIQCLRGEVEISIDNGAEKSVEKLSGIEYVLLIPTLHWISLKFLETNSQVIVYASHPYEEKDYLRNYDEFIGLMTRLNRGNTE